MTELTYSLPEKGEALGNSDAKIREGLSKIKETVNGKLDHTNLASAGVVLSNLSDAVQGGLGKSFVNLEAAGLTRASTSYGSFSTPVKATLESVAANSVIGFLFQGYLKGGTSAAVRITTSAGTPTGVLELASTTNSYASGHYVAITTANNGLSKVETDLGTEVTNGYPLPIFSTPCYAILNEKEGSAWIEIQGKASSGTATLLYPKLYIWAVA